MDDKIFKKTIPKRARRSEDANYRQIEAAMSVPPNDDTPRTLIKNILKAGDFWPSFETKTITPLKQSNRKPRKSKTPNVASPARSASKKPIVASPARSASKTPNVASPTRSASKTPNAASPARSASKTPGTKLTESERNNSDTLDSFVLPRYRTGRRQIGKKQRNKPTKADVEAFAAGAEAILAAREFLSTSESETEISSASSSTRRVSASGNAMQDSYAADSFVLRPYNAGRRILKKKRRVPGPDEARAFAKAVDEIEDGNYLSMTSDESSTDSRARNPKRISRDVSNMIENSQKRLSTSVTQTKTTPRGTEDDDNIVKTGNSNTDGYSSTSKKPRKRDSSRFYVSDLLTEETSSRDIMTRPKLLGTSASQRITGTGSKKANMTPQDAVTLFKKRSLQYNSMDVASPNDSENHGFSPKLSSTRINQRHSSSFKEKILTPFASRTNQLSQKILATSSPSKKLPIRSPQKNKSTDARHVSHLTFSPKSSSFQEEFYTRPASNVKESSRQLAIRESDSEEMSGSPGKSNQRSRTAGTSTRYTQSQFEDDEAGESLINERSLRSKLKVDSATGKTISDRSPKTREMVLPPGTAQISPKQFSPTNRSTGPRHALHLPESPTHSLASHARPALRLSEHSEQSNTEEDELAQDPAFSGGSRRSSRTTSRLTSVHEQVRPQSTSRVSPLNRSTGSQRALLLPESPKRSLAIQNTSHAKPSSRRSEHSEQSDTEENELAQDPAFSGGPHRSSRTSSRLTSDHEQVKVLPPGASPVSPKQFSPTNKSTRPRRSLPLPESPRRSLLLPESPRHSLSIQNSSHARPASRLSEDSKQSDTEENELAQDPALSGGPRRSPRTTSLLTSVHEQDSTKKDDLSVRRKLNVSSSRKETANDSLLLPPESSMNKSKSLGGFSLSSGKKTPYSSTRKDLNKSSGRRSMMQSQLVFSPKSSGKLRFSNPKTSRVTGSEIEARENESHDSVRRKSKDKLKRQRDSAFPEDSNSESDDPFWNAAKPSTSRKNNSDEDPKTRFRNRKGPLSSPSDSESDSTIDINKSTKTLPKTKKTATGGQISAKAQTKEEFVPLSGTKANFEHFLQKRIMRATAMEVQKHVNRFFRMTRDEMQKMVAKKPATKQYISPTEIKNMFVKQGLFESLAHLEMNARQWLDSDGQEMVVEYQEAFQNIKYD